MAKKIEAEAPAYGQGQVLDAAAQSLQTATETPPPGPDAQAVQAALAGQSQGAPTGQAPAQPQQGTTVQNRFMLLPPNINFRAQQQKTPGERDYGMSLFWNILAGESQVDPTASLIAKKLSSTS